MNFFIYESMSTQAVWIRSLTYLALFTAFLKHSCNLSSVKGDPSLKKKKKDKQTVTEQQNNLMSPASPGRIHQILVTTPQTKAVLSSEPAFFRNIVLRDPNLNPVNRPNREHRRKRIP